MRRLALALLLLLVVSGCGTAGARLTTAQVAAAARDAGLRGVLVWNIDRAMPQMGRLSPDAAKGLAIDFPPDGHWVFVPRSRSDAFVSPLAPFVAVVYPDADSAKRRYAADVGFYDSGDAAMRKLVKIGTHIDLSRMREALVCNVVVSSYSPTPDVRPAGRYARVVALLRNRCR